jgi:hypothetical protein
MACFRVRALDVVTAAGERLTINERSHPDLYWAARGAGPAFCAVATRFHLEAFPYPRGMRAGRLHVPDREGRERCALAACARSSASRTSSSRWRSRRSREPSSARPP